MKYLLTALLLSGCTFGYNATHPTRRPSTQAELAALSPKMRKLAEQDQQAPVYCMLGDMGLTMGGFAALSVAQGLERRGVIDTTWVEPINLAGLAVTAVTFISLGLSVKLFGHL